MTGLDLINKFQKDIWNKSDELFENAFDNIFSNLSLASHSQTFPFYNVVKYGKSEYGIELGLAGFNKKNVKVQYKDGVLTVSGQVNDEEKEYIKKGLALRKFAKQFSLRDDVIVNEAEMEDGVLTIKLGVQEPKNIEIKDINIK
ncbi:MAG: Hsp20/alpha crystallin family protein [Pelagibacteraceae bacterium]